MRVLILTKKELANAFTGDNTQMRKTISWLRQLIDEVTHVYVQDNGNLYDKNGLFLQESFESLCARNDVVHQLPRLNIRAHKAVQTVLSRHPVVLSTIFWHDRTRLQVAWNNADNIVNKTRSAASAYRAGMKRFLDYRKGCDVLLPNSWAEGDNAREHFRLASHVLVKPIPNAIELPSFNIDELSKPKCIPFDEYIVCPAAFASRKNQIGLIKAMQDCDVPIVFMGNPLASARKYWLECKRLATSRMIFIEHQNSTESVYWAVLRHSRCACLASDCETPGIALLEAAVAGARPVVTQHGGTPEYYGFCAEYLDPTSAESIRSAVLRGWARGQLSKDERQSFLRFTWKWAAALTVEAYRDAIRLHHAHMH